MPDSGIPLTGFVRVSSESSQSDSTYLGLRVMKEIHLPAICSTIELQNYPLSVTSPLVGSPIFTLQSDLMVNNRAVWSNGQEYIFFILHNIGSRGNWVIGGKAGEDNGYVYIDGPQYSLTPLQLEHDAGAGPNRMGWRWLDNGEWTAQPSMEAHCVDDHYPTSFYEIEYFDPVDNLPYASSFYLINSQVDEVDWEGVFFNQREREWQRVNNISPLLALGQPVKLLPDNSLALLVNAEHASQAGWRLTLRLVQREAIDHAEKSIILTARGFYSLGFNILPLSYTQQIMHYRKMTSELTALNVGDYAWLWYRTNQTESDHQEREELLVQCITSSPITMVFRFFPTNRKDIMKRSILHENLDVLVLRLNNSGQLSATLAGQDVVLYNSVTIGPNLEAFIWKYLFYKENEFPDHLSACFFYHAAVSMPQVLVYAGELLCLIAGGKPVVMVQYTSPTDHQWKFPLVEKLTRGIVAAKEVFGESLGIDYTTFYSGQEETVIFYRTNRRYLVDLLRPYHEAQALHLLPIVDVSNTLIDHNAGWREQIYNAAWNGLVLGYPSYFVSSYCNDFPNSLTTEEKHEIFLQAQHEFDQFMIKEELVKVSIHLGLDSPITSDKFPIVIESL
eukprot:scaffold428_cov168-Ochromonas_danica.AAC.9